MGQPRFSKKTINDNRARSNRSNVRSGSSANSSAKAPANNNPNVKAAKKQKDVKVADKAAGSESTTSQASEEEEEEQIPQMGEIVVITDEKGRQHEVLLKPNGARLSCGWLGDTEIVEIVNRYSPYRDVACSICGVPYGALGVAGRGEDVRSHEIRLDSRDATCFIPRILSRADGHSWERWEKRQERRERKSLNRIDKTLTEYRASRAPVSTSTGSSDSSAEGASA